MQRNSNKIASENLKFIFHPCRPIINFISLCVSLGRFALGTCDSYARVDTGWETEVIMLFRYIFKVFTFLYLGQKPVFSCYISLFI